MTTKQQRIITALLPIAISFLGLFIFIIKPGFIESYEDKTYDLRYKTRGPVEPTKEVAVIAIDEKTLKELGRWQDWSRTNYADIINAVTAAGARGLFFDVLFPESERGKADDTFADAVRKSGIVTLAVNFDFNEAGELGITDITPTLRAATDRFCHVNIFPEEDGVVRYIPLIINDGDTPYLSMGLAGAMAAMGVNDFMTDAAGFRITLTDGKNVKTIPVSASRSHFQTLINYRGPGGTYDTYSMVDVIKGRVGEAELKDRVLLLGATAIGIYDLRVTPLDPNSPGVELYANILDNILNNDFMVRGAAQVLMDMFFILFLVFATSTIIIKVKPLISFPAVFGLMFAYIYFAYFLFTKGQWISIAYPSISLFLSFVSASALRFFVVEKSAREVKSMFTSYVSKKIVDELVKNPELGRVGGQRKKITILFSDVIGYTSYSEGREPEEVVATLNEYLAAMVDVIMHHDGTLDKFIGDAILAFWGAPIDQPNQHELAARCAVAMCDRLRELQEKWKSEGREPLRHGLGLNTGVVIVGNIGVEGKKMDYTVIGDNVNMTQRLEAYTREAKREIIISETLYETIKDIAVVEHIGTISVKGKKTQINAFALTGMKDKGARQGG